MNIFSILTESRNPSYNKGKTYSDLVHNRQMRIVVEAEEDDNKAEQKDDALSSKPNDNKPEEKPEDNKEEKEDDNKDEEQDEPENPDENEEPGEDDLDSPGLDDDMSGGDTTSNTSYSSSTDTSIEDLPEDEIDPDRTKAHALLDDAVTLYYSIKRIIDKLDNVTGDTVEVIQTFIEAKDNFINLSDLLFDFITQRFTTNTYVKNLYIFNYFIQCWKNHLNK